MNEARPLADILRPKNLDEVVGQEHLVGKSGVIRKMLSSNFLPSMIFWGPPGCGKTTLAYLLATLTDSEFVSKSAVTTTLAEVRGIIKNVTGRTIFFLDEIHRFNKAQQDALLPAVEKGTIILIGATTENPSFEVISPLLSRCRVVVLKQLSSEELKKIAWKGLKYLQRKMDANAEIFLLEVANGDARALLNILEIASQIIFSPRLPLRSYGCLWRF